MRVCFLVGEIHMSRSRPRHFFLPGQQFDQVIVADHSQIWNSCYPSNASVGSPQSGDSHSPPKNEE